MQLSKGLKGAFLAFFERPIAGALGVATLLIWVTMLWRGINRSTVPAGPTAPPE
jgi:putative tricarboxylic transport membrane protein